MSLAVAEQAKKTLDDMGVTEPAGLDGRFRIAKVPKKKDLAAFVYALRTLGANSVDTGYGGSKRSVGAERGYKADELIFRLKKEGEE